MKKNNLFLSPIIKNCAEKQISLYSIYICIMMDKNFFRIEDKQKMEIQKREITILK